MAVFTKSVSQSKDDSSDLNLQGRNDNFTGNTILVGKDAKFGLTYGSLMVFQNFNIPKGSVVSSATLTLDEALDGTGVDSFTAFLRYGINDGKWNVASRTGWSRTETWDAEFINKISGGTAKDSYTISASPANWEMNLLTSPQKFSKLFQSFTNKQGSNYSLATTELRLKKVGAPTGNLTLELYAVDGDGLPTGSPLATSNTVAESSLSTAYGLISFTWGTPYTVVDETTYALVLSSSSSPHASNYIHWRCKGTNSAAGGEYAFGYFGSYGIGEGQDDQNYMDDWMRWNSPSVGGTAQNWVLTKTALGGGTQISGNIATLIQEWIDAVGYVENVPFMLKLQQLNAVKGDEYYFASWDNPTYAAPLLTITYTPPVFINHGTIVV